jgi:N-acetylglutamate synthase-like GNAT family acetyltransferase
MIDGKKYFPKEIIKMLDKEQGNLYVLKERKKIIGCVVININNQEAELSHLAVLLEYHGKGYGEVLLDYSIKHCINEKAERILTTMPRIYEPLFARKGFNKNQNKVVMEWVYKEKEQQSNLGERLKDISHVEDIGEKTAERLRKLRVR